ncbi:MAG: ROK family protein [Litorilinea sp.]
MQMRAHASEEAELGAPTGPRHVVGIDLGGTQMRVILADFAGQIVRRATALTLADEGPDAVLARLIQLVESVIAGDAVAGLAVGAPGPTDPYRGVVLMGPNLPGWHNVNLRTVLGDAFHVPVAVGNDANLAGLAEYRFGAGQGTDHMIYITVSTGIGTGIIVDGHLLLGRQGLAAEAGHMTLDAAAEGEDSHVVGTLEGLASGPNIARRAQLALRGGAASMITGMVDGDLDAVTPRLLLEAARAGDVFALDQFQIAGRYIGMGITNLLHIFNPDRIVIGGSIWLHCYPFLEDAVWKTIHQRAESPAYWQQLQILPAELGDDTGLLGAVALALEQAGKAPTRKNL